MLAVVSAVVAFDRWPGAHVQAPLQTLVLTDKAPPIRVSAKAGGPSAAATAHGASAGRTAVRGAQGTHDAGGVAGERITGGTRTPAPDHAPVAVAPGVTKTLQPVQDTASPIFDAVSNPRTTAGQVADGTQAVTNAAGGSLTAVSPDLGTAVGQAGQAAADTVRELPLPGHILPGY